MTNESDLDVPDEYLGAISREWDRLAHSGSFFSSWERAALAVEARRARDADPEPTGLVSEPAAAAARMVSVTAMDIRIEWVLELEQAGLSRLHYVEIVGLVSRLDAIDRFDFGMGRATRPLPSPLPGGPTGAAAESARMRGAWVPTVGPPRAPSALSAITAEHEAMHDIHAVFFIPDTSIPDFGLTKDLIRPQMELVAARTSMVNECFY